MASPASDIVVKGICSDSSPATKLAISPLGRRFLRIHSTA